MIILAIAALFLLTAAVFRLHDIKEHMEYISNKIDDIESEVKWFKGD